MELCISDKCMGLVESLEEYYPDAKWQRCTVHFYRNVFAKVPNRKIKEVVAMLKAIHAQEDHKAAIEKSKLIIKKLEQMKLPGAAEIVKTGIGETLEYIHFPREHWRFIKTNNPMERIMKEIRRRTRVVGSFPDGHSALMLVTARLRYIASHSWGTRRYLNMTITETDQKEEVLEA